MNNGVYDQESVVLFAAFRDHGLGKDCGVSKLFQVSHNCAISTVKEFSKTF